MIQTRQITKRYGDRVAVAGVDLDIGRGEAFGLLGPNGAGKTTTIHMLIGVLEPDGGEITIGEALDPMRPSTRRCIGIAPQSLSLYEEMTGQQNLAFFGKLYGLSGRRLRDRVAWALDFSGLTDRASDLVKAYSGGMQRRLNLACALVHEPDVVLCDEPTVGVDPQSRNHIFDCIERLKSDGMTIVYTTHYMEEAQRLCDRVAIMDQGALLAVDTVDGLIGAHGGTSVVTASFNAPPSPDQVNGLGGSLDGDTMRIETADPMGAAASIAKLDVRSLRIDRPDLESVFLSLTGRSLRDE